MNQQLTFPDNMTALTVRIGMFSGDRRSVLPSERFLAKIEVTDSCWLWLGKLQNAGGQ